MYSFVRTITCLPLYVVASPFWFREFDFGMEVLLDPYNSTKIAVNYSDEWTVNQIMSLTFYIFRKNKVKIYSSNDSCIWFEYIHIIEKDNFCILILEYLHHLAKPKITSGLSWSILLTVLHRYRDSMHNRQKSLYTHTRLYSTIENDLGTFRREMGNYDPHMCTCDRITPLCTEFMRLCRRKI